MTAQRTPSGGPTPVPALFDAVVGQESAVATLTAAAARPVHAYLFVGPPGSGARAAVEGFAAALLCRDGGCGNCRDCQLALAGRHPDLVVLQRSGAALSVEEARRLVGMAQRRPFEADRQVLVLPDVHLAVRAAPALLKTIEEPPGPTVFVLLADHVPPELATVASRCLVVPFAPLSRQTVIDALEARGVPSKVAAQAAENSGGDLERARLLAEDPELARRTALWQSTPSRLDGSGAAVVALTDEILAAMEAALEPLRQRHRDELEGLAEEAAATGERGVPGRKEVTDRQRREERRWRTEELRAGLAALARAYRDRLVGGLVSTSGSHVPAKELLAERRSIERLGTVTAALEHNPNQRLLLEALLLDLSRI